ncbi:hypothetical protein AB0P17_36455 [Streptomyces sp. NPDC088124]|uniref:hypothetical protein n=1 Tax=Streptomyces sp. NPDC088124 TaxID=3154654 RepID=UPI00341F8827
MATGPQHYREAERLAALAHHFTYGDVGDPVTGAALATEAQAHATLALAAATAQSASVDGDPDSGMPPADISAWHAAVGTTPQTSKDGSS